MGFFCRDSGGCGACKAKDQTITVLADEVDYLRHQIAKSPVIPSALVAASPEPMQMEVFDSDDLRMSEEEEEIRFAQAMGTMSPTEADAAIQALKS
jgi:hypothetical protein